MHLYTVTTGDPWENSYTWDSQASVGVAGLRLVAAESKVGEDSRGTMDVLKRLFVFHVRILTGLQKC